MTKIQTCGGYNEDDGYSFTIAFGDGPCMTLEGLTVYQKRRDIDTTNRKRIN